jgi:hypothetical protein
MISPAEIVKKAERKFRDVLRAHLDGESLFPMEFPVGQLSNNLAERRQRIEELRQSSKENIGQGYTLEWQTTNQRDLGKQTTPRRVVIETLCDYLAVVRKRTEYGQFVADIEHIRRQFPELENWLCTNPQAIIENSGHWDDLLKVCDYFLKHPRPNMYIRELPIPVHTKFIEQHSRILRDLLDTLLPPDAVIPDSADFNQRFGVKSPPTRIRMRLLEEQLDWQYGLRLDDMTLPVDQLAYLLAEHIKPHRVVIVENLINFLTLPKIPDGAVIFGGGFAVHLLREVQWLNQCDVIYWGDIDAHGFEILSDLRELFPRVRSLMMDQETLEMYTNYIVRGVRSRLQRFGHLTEAEALVVQDVIDNDLRLEQEHIHQEYAVACLRKLLLDSTER